ncbi:DUF3575 domain-containing protein [uncultured Bacteroides sp.]|uniref:DUF3575 domain-containing protein n=1 Tax=uncultured Bacteroides sp. TaxID=162156 RepID=UPI0025D7834D|nr:DUF3575 domain-containing protein [uncultured Bacteroides sp.]
MFKVYKVCNSRVHRLLLFRTIAVLLLAVYAPDLSAQHVALKTNVLYWATSTPNIGVETRISPRWTLGFNAGYNPFTFSDNSKLRHLLVQPEARYWLCSTFAGHFVGANMFYSHYNAGNIDLPFGMLPELSDHRFQGDLAGAGLFYGYSWMLGKRWSIEAALGLGAAFTSYRKYLCEKCGTQVGKDKRWYLAPTKLAVSVVYYIE